MRHRRLRTIAGPIRSALLLLLASSLAGDARAQTTDHSTLLTADDLVWQDLGGGLRRAVLYGDASVEGAPFAFRLEAPDGFEAPPHTHPVTEHMTVLSGRFFVGIGATFDRSTAREYGPGSYVVVEKDVPAYMFTVGTTVVQIHGIGPLRTIPVTGRGGG